MAPAAPYAVVAAYLIGTLRSRGVPPDVLAAHAQRTATLAVLAALLAALAAGLLSQPLVASGMLLLVSLIAWVIVRFSTRYLAGEPGVPRYFRSLMDALTAISLVVVTENLLVLALAWFYLSLPLNSLLSFYDQRPAALLAAHKKLVFERVADALLLTSVTLLWTCFGSLDVAEIRRAASTQPVLPLAADVALVCLALCVVIKSAQLPFHGWLIQVMEAPTPVSALLHAGVVNLGGFVLLGLAPLVERSPAACAVLVVFGTATATLAALVASTRVSVKVALAWSTCAQMGFMLLECGMGWWAAAFVHLIAHSLYKAHAFLSSGETVRRTYVARLAPAVSAPGGRTVLLAALATSGSLAALAWLTEEVFRVPGRVGLWTWIVGAGLLPLLWIGGVPPLRRVPRFAALAVWLVVLHHAVGAHVVSDAPSLLSSPVLVPVVAGVWAVFGALQMLLWLGGRDARFAGLHRLFYAGLFLDAWMTRVLLALWPPRRKLMSDHRPTHRLVAREVSQ